MNVRRAMGKIPAWEFLVPGCVTASLLVMFFNVPGPLMDWLLSLNITLSVVILLTTFFVKKPLEFSVFPTLLLATTLFRLVLNVGTTRLILTRADSLGDQAAGGVISAFSRFVTGDSLVVGMVIFAIFVVIQFVVITKGATRISEVTARFTLDALPGRQMAIDADLAAGHIDEKTARRLRDELAESADFFGAMDGAGKFVRGDAIAGLLIISVNIIGGVLIGTIQNGKPMAEVFSVYTALTIGDGLVSQVPALLISLATGILVSRSGRSVDLSKQVVGQLLLHPAVFVLGGMFLGLLIITGMPALPLSVTATGCFLLAAILTRSRRHREESEKERRETEDREKKEESERQTRERIENRLAVYPMELEIGVGLVRLINQSDSGQRGGGIKEIVRRIRGEVAEDIGIILPSLRIRDRLELDDCHYRVKIAGETVDSGLIRPGMFLAVDAERTGSRLEGIRTTDPATGLTAFWTDPRFREKAEIYGFRALEPAEVLSGHLKAIIRREAASLLTRDLTVRLLTGLRETSPALVDELIPDLLKPGEIQQILRRLLREQVPIRPLETILEALGDSAVGTKNPILLTELVRQRMARTFSNRFRDASGAIHALLLDPAMENLIRENCDLNGEEPQVLLSPADSDDFCRRIGDELQNAAIGSEGPILLVSPAIRPAVSELLRDSFPRLTVLSFREITRDTRVETDGIVRPMKMSA